MAITPLKGIGFLTEVQATLGSALTITAITQANPGVATSTAHGLSNGDVVVLTVAGMVGLNQQAARVSSVATNTFALEGIDTSSMPAFTSGTCQKVATWNSLGWCTAVNMAGGSPKTADLTTLADTQAQEGYLMAAAGSGTLEGFDQIGDTGILNLRAASDATATRAFRCTYASGQKRIFNANVSAGGGFSIAANDVGKLAPVAVTVRGSIREYTS